MAHRPTRVLSLLAAALLSQAPAAAQELPLDDALRAAIAIEELEHDLVTARTRYAELARDATRGDALRRHAWLRLGKLARARGDTESAREALAAAARGDDATARAAQAIAQQEPQDLERARQLAEGAERAVAAYLEGRNRGGDAFENLSWFGDAAVLPLIRRYLAGRDEDSASPLVDHAGGALWRLGTPAALAFLQEQLADPDLRHRRAIARGLAFGGIPATAAALVARALNDADDEVVLAALRRPELLDVEALCDRIASARAALRIAGLEVLLSRLASTMGGVGSEHVSLRISRRVARLLEPTLESTSPQEFRAASECLLSSACFSSEGRALLARWLPRLTGVPRPPLPHPRSTDFDGEAENAAVLAQSIASFTPATGELARTAARSLVELYVEHKAWKRAALDAVLTIARHGYLDLEIALWLERNGLPEDAPRVVDALADSTALSAASGWLSRQPLGEAQFDAIRRTLDWLQSSDEGGRWSPAPLVVALGATGHPDALAWLRRLAAAGSKRLPESSVASGAIWLNQRRNDEATRAFLVELLERAPVADHARRIALVAQLVRSGDRRVWELLPGMRQANQQLVSPLGLLPDTDGVFHPQSMMGLDSWLTHSFRREGRRRWWHGYDDVQLDALWTNLLARGEQGYGPYWKECAPLAYAANESSDSVPGALYLALCEAHRARCSDDEDFDPERSALVPLLWAADQAPSADAARRAALAALRDAALTARSSKVRALAVFQIEQRRDEATRALLLRLCGDPSSSVAMRAWEKLDEFGAALDHTRVARGLASADRDMRLYALERSAACSEPLAELVAPLLRDPESELRIAACRHFAARVDLNAVPALLETLKDADEPVRRAAAESLQAIRLYHDESARWARVLGGKPELGKAAAAEALVDQASATNELATRLLAIRSLGLLAAPETLPLLITWTKDEDAQIAAAAREALQRILGMGK